MLTAEQIVAANKANVETLYGLTAKAFAGVEKMVELNLAASKAILADASNQTQSVMSVKDVQELMALQSSMLQPLAEKTAAYSRNVYDIATGTSAQFGKAFEAQTAEGQQKLMSLVESTVQNAPAGSETAVAFMKGAVTAANNAFETVQKSVKQAAELVESNFNAVAANATAATTAAKPARKR